MLAKKTITGSDWQQIRHIVPGAEPVLRVKQRSASMTAVRPTIPVSEPCLNGNELRYVTECIQSSWISSAGPFVGRFEEQFAAAAGCAHGIACNSGTTALHLALAALGIAPGDEVIVPTFTMIATAYAVDYLGATPVFVDADPETWNLDADRIEAKITSRTKAIIVVHVYGHPADMDPIVAIARRHGLFIVEDAAEAHGAEYLGRRVGTLGDVACFSFYANKIVTTGEGGMVTTSNRQLAETVRCLRDHAFSDERHFWHQYRGYSFRMTGLQAAIGLAQTERLEELVAQRRRNACLYSELLGAVPGLTLPVERPGVKSVFWMYACLIQPGFGCSRDELRERLAWEGIETRTFFVPLHLQPVYFTHYSSRSYPVADSICQKGLYLPSSGALTPDEIRCVAQAVICAGKAAPDQNCNYGRYRRIRLVSRRR